LADREEGAEGAAEEDGVVAGGDWARKRGFVAVQGGEDAREDGGRGAGGEKGLLGFEGAVEVDKFGEEGEDEGEGDLKGSDGLVVSWWVERGHGRETHEIEEEGDEEDAEDLFASGDLLGV